MSGCMDFFDGYQIFTSSYLDYTCPFLRSYKRLIIRKDIIIILDDFDFPTCQNKKDDPDIASSRLCWKFAFSGDIHHEIHWS